MTRLATDVPADGCASDGWDARSSNVFIPPRTMFARTPTARALYAAVRPSPMHARRAPALVVARLRPGRQGIQRIYRLAREKEMIGEYEYLESIGVPRAQALQVMAQASTAFEREAVKRGIDPGTLTYGSEDMSEVVEFLIESGVAASEVGALVIRHPAVLAYGVETRLKPLFEYMECTFGRDAKAFVEDVTRRPSLLGLDADANARKMIEYLLDNGSTKEEAMEYFLRSL
jgi:hypothetical protein